MAAMKDREEVGAASVDYLMYSGYACLAYFWADMARVAAEKLAEGSSEEAFYKAKLQTARFYFQRILPRTRLHVDAMLRSEERRVGEECVSTCRSRGSRVPSKKKQTRTDRHRKKTQQT